MGAFSFILLEIGLSSDPRDGGMFGGEITGLADSCLLGGDVVNKFSKSCYFTVGVSAQDSHSYVRVPHAMDEELLDHIVPVADLQVACTLNHHATHVCGGGNSGCKCTDGLI